MGQEKTDSLEKDRQERELEAGTGGAIWDPLDKSAETEMRRQ